MTGSMGEKNERIPVSLLEQEARQEEEKEGRDGMEEGKDNKVNRTCLKPSVSVTIHGIPKASSTETS